MLPNIQNSMCPGGEAPQDTMCLGPTPQDSWAAGGGPSPPSGKRKHSQEGGSTILVRDLTEAAEPGTKEAITLACLRLLGMSCLWLWILCFVAREPAPRAPVTAVKRNQTAYNAVLRILVAYGFGAKMPGMHRSRASHGNVSLYTLNSPKGVVLCVRDERARRSPRGHGAGLLSQQASHTQTQRHQRTKGDRGSSTSLRR